MAWLLCRAALRCQARRLGDLARLSPLIAVLVGLSLAGGPLGGYLAARAAGRAMGDALADPRVARLLVVGLALPAIAAGAAIAATASSHRTLGNQVAGAPLRRSAIALAALSPLLLSGVAVTPLCASLVLPIVSAGPAGLPAGLAVCLVLAMSAAAGAVLAEALIGAARRSLPHTGLALVLAAVVTAAGALRLDPTRPLAEIVTSKTDAARALAVAPAAAVVLLAVWCVARGSRPVPIARRPRLGLRAPLAHAPLLGFGLAVLTRRVDTRLALGAGIAFGGAGVVIGWLVGVRGVEAAAAGLAPALAASVIAPLALGGVASEARWLLGSAPASACRRGLGLTLAACVCMALVVTAGLAVSLPAGSIDRDLVVLAALASALATASGVVAGALVPWRSQGFADQLTAIVALGAVAGALGGLTMVVTSLGDRIGAGTAAGAALPALALLLAAASLSRRTAV